MTPPDPTSATFWHGKDEVQLLAGLLARHAPLAFDRFIEAMLRDDDEAMVAAMVDGVAMVQERAGSDAERAALAAVREAFLVDARESGLL